MNRYYLILTLVLLGTLSACHSDNDPALNLGPIMDTGDPTMNTPDPVTPDQPDTGTTDFNGFTKNLLAVTADDSEPFDIDTVTFNFNEDEMAFDDVL